MLSQPPVYVLSLVEAIFLGSQFESPGLDSGIGTAAVPDWLRVYAVCSAYFLCESGRAFRNPGWSGNWQFSHFWDWGEAVGGILCRFAHLGTETDINAGGDRVSRSILCTGGGK